MRLKRECGRREASEIVDAGFSSEGWKGGGMWENGGKRSRKCELRSK
jgi:hypothetical protein